MHAVSPSAKKKARRDGPTLSSPANRRIIATKLSHRRQPSSSSRSTSVSSSSAFSRLSSPSANSSISQITSTVSTPSVGSKGRPILKHLTPTTFSITKASKVAYRVVIATENAFPDRHETIRLFIRVVLNIAREERAHKLIEKITSGDRVTKSNCIHFVSATISPVFYLLIPSS